MDTLVVLGTTTTYIFSAFNTFPTPIWHNIYYDAPAVVVTFILLGKYLERKTKGKTGSIIKKMFELQPKTATNAKEEILFMFSTDMALSSYNMRKQTERFGE